MLEKNQLNNTIESGVSKSSARQATLAYFLGWVTGIIFLVLSTKNKDNFVKFHALQSTITFGGLSVIQWILNKLIQEFFVSLSISLVIFILWIILMVHAHRGERYRLPLVGKLVEQWSSKSIN